MCRYTGRAGMHSRPSWACSSRHGGPVTWLRSRPAKLRVGQRALVLETGDDPDPEVGFPRGGADERGDDAGRQAREIAEEGTAVEAVGAEPLGDGEDHLAVRDGGEERLVEPEGPVGEPPGVAAISALGTGGSGPRPLVSEWRDGSSHESRRCRPGRRLIGTAESLPVDRLRVAASIASAASWTVITPLSFGEKRHRPPS